MLRKILIFCCLLSFIPELFSAEDLLLRGEKFGNWFQMNAPVVFRSATMLSAEEKLIGTIYDIQGKEIAVQEVGGTEFNRSGWRWQPVKPGFYEIRFFRGNNPVMEQYDLTIPQIDPVTKERKTIAKETFAIDRHAVAVVAGPTPSPKEISPIFGASIHVWAREREIPLSALIGFHSLRMHVISWDKIESSKGRFDWTQSDECVSLAREAGYSDNQLVFNVIDTPKWAANRPDMEYNHNPGASPLYRGHAPRDIADWRDFLTALVRRYPGVMRYEIWNEPNFPGYSSFFYESPEKFVPLDIEGYKAIKAANPNAIVWLHGFEGEKYRDFYRTILPMGVDKSFDVLALHSRYADPLPYQMIDRRLGLPPRPWVNSEWHANLFLPMSRNIPTEADMPRDMLLSFLLQVARGAEEIDLFSILNLPSCERESLEFLKKHKYNFSHFAGLFRNRPYPQPRYAGLAWHIFSTSFRGRIAAGKGYAFKKQRVQAASSDAGILLIVWNEDNKALAVEPEIIAAAGINSVVLNPDGSPFNMVTDLLHPGSYLLIRNARPEIVAGWTNFAELLKDGKQLPLPLERKATGYYRTSPLFDAEMNDIQPGLFVWQETGNPVTAVSSAQAAPIRADFSVGVGPEYVDLIVTVRDATHVGSEIGMTVWNYDSVQFAFDTRGNGRKEDIIEFAAAQGKDGKAVLWKVVAPSLKGEMISAFTIPGNLVENGTCLINRERGVTTYRIRIAKSEFYPLTFKSGELRFAFLVNNNDGTGRAFYQGWGDGIGDVKDPTLYGSLYVKGKSGILLDTRAFRHLGWKKDYKLELLNQDTTAASVKITIGPQRVAGVFSDPFDITPGGRYRVTFRARGTTRFTFAIDPARTGKTGMPRKDLILPYPLTQEFQEFSQEFIAGEYDNRCGFMFFGWEQPDTWFEISDFKVVAK